MARKKQLSSGMSRHASRHIGVFVGTAVGTGVGIAHALKRTVLAAGNGRAKIEEIEHTPMVIVISEKAVQKIDIARLLSPLQ